MDGIEKECKSEESVALVQGKNGEGLNKDSGRSDVHKKCYSFVPNSLWPHGL